VFDALEWLSAMPGAAKPCEECSHMYQLEGNPADAGPVMEFIRLWRSYYSNVARGKRKKTDADLSAEASAQAGDKIPCILELELTDKAFRKNWARLIQKIGACPPFFGRKLIHYCVINVLRK